MTEAGGRRVLVLNAGSSSLKFALFDGADRRASGQVEGIGTTPRFISGAGAELLPSDTRHRDALDRILAELDVLGAPVSSVAACGHRLVHGGRRFVAPMLVDDRSLAAINQLRDLAPLHNGYGADAIESMRAVAPAMPQVACFDTAFHATIPEVAARYAIPRELHEAGYRRYGFHGLNFEHVTATVTDCYGSRGAVRLLIFHLGNGSSVCAVRNGVSVATTMGYSTLDGLVMGTRCGAIDPGVLIALQRREGLSLDALEDLLYRRSGLLALSGVSSDMRTIEEASDVECRFAVEHFSYWAARHAGSLAVAMGGVDALAFTGGIGANSATVRGLITGHLEWLGVELEPDLNVANAPVISSGRSKCPVWVVAADEERAILRHVRTALDARH